MPNDPRIEALGYNAMPIQCTAEEWPSLRTALQKRAGEWVDSGQDIRAQMALSEVKRLDAKFPAAEGEQRRGKGRGRSEQS